MIEDLGTVSPKIVREMLSKWYRKCGRKLPWRETRDPYAIWISEIMLQQTQADRVIPFFERFLGRFPTVESLAKASWRELLPYWRGLGYYARGRNLLAAGKSIVREHGGRVPAKREELVKLPGIGKYTASAIASFAFGEPVPAIDTNLRRVLGRVFGCNTAQIEEKANLLFREAPRSGGELNHALMDIGALFCKSRKAECAHCPLQKICVFARSPQPDSQAGERGKGSVRRPAVQVGAACIHRNGEYLIAQRTNGIWEFPGGKREKGEDIRGCLKREILEELGVEVAVRPAFLTEDFLKEGKLYRLYFCRSQILRGVPRCRVHKSLRWVPAEGLSRFRFAGTNAQAVKHLQKF